MQPTQEKDFTLSEVVLAVSLELAQRKWKVALHDGRRAAPAVRTVSGEPAAYRLGEVVAVIEAVRKKWGLAEGTRVVVCYEAGQDGFWIERALSAMGYEVKVVDPASVPVERHGRRAKTDRLDAIKLVTNLQAWLRGERDRLRMVRVPTPEAEAQRHLVRERGQLQKEIGQHRDRIGKLLCTVGATRLTLELFWRDFANRRQVGSCVGLVPQPYDSGESRVDQGISKQGNRRVRALLIEMAWLWLRYQPESALSKWFAQRCCGSAANKRHRRVAIVAVARKLAVALWRYVKDGVVPAGAQLKAA